ncbi:hypothetical protein DPMN_066773 [Dreissena polymorpha]|uniref:Uncharacterized protein n=1 Tax=Dreissena polymorpha TaxID=45954 RepID=A0A9D3YZN1_DREPO|nr:hypothetical protein DPMN_066773 [Dreissena polymorpha]
MRRRQGEHIDGNIDFTNKRKTYGDAKVNTWMEISITLTRDKHVVISSLGELFHLDSEGKNVTAPNLSEIDELDV